MIHNKDLEKSSGNSGPQDGIGMQAQKSFDFVVDESKCAHERKATWKTVGILQICDVVGTGILGLGHSYSILGMLPSIILTIFFLPINVYCGWVMQEIFLYKPGSTSWPKMAQNAFNNKIVTWIVKVLYYSFIFFVCGQYTQVIGDAIKGLLIYIDVCQYSFAFIAAVIIIPLAQVRTLNDSIALQLVNTVSITLVVVIAVIFMLVHMNVPVEELEKLNYVEPPSFQDTVLIAKDLTFAQAMNAIGIFVFAYNGNTVYPEMIAEMKDPRDFHKAFYLSSPYQLVMYLLAAITQYSYGFSGKIYKAIPIDNPLYGVTAFLLIVHVLCAYLIKGTILARIIHVKVHPETVNDRGTKGSAIWFGITSILVMFAALVSVAIPDFNVLTDMISDLQLAPLGLFIPPLMLLAVRKQTGRSTGCFEYFAIAVICSVGVLIATAGTVISITAAVADLKNGKAFMC